MRHRPARENLRAKGDTSKLAREFRRRLRTGPQVRRSGSGLRGGGAAFVGSAVPLTN
jgi:hypothetical protein